MRWVACVASPSSPFGCRRGRETNRRARADVRKFPSSGFGPLSFFRTSPLLHCLSTKNFLPSTFASWALPRSRHREITMNPPIHSRSQSSSEIHSRVNTPLHPCLGYSFYLLTSVVVSPYTGNFILRRCCSPCVPFARSRARGLWSFGRAPPVCVRPPATATLGSVTRFGRPKRSLLVLSVRACAHHHHALAEVRLFCTIDNLSYCSLIYLW